MLKRAPWKKFGANRYTGIGGKVEPSEHAEIEKAAIRELEEETEIKADDLTELTLKGKLLAVGPEEDNILYFFTAKCTRDDIPLDCNEGELAWFDPLEAAQLPLVGAVEFFANYIIKQDNKRFLGSLYRDTEEWTVINY